MCVRALDMTVLCVVFDDLHIHAIHAYVLITSTSS